MPIKGTCKLFLSSFQSTRSFNLGVSSEGGTPVPIPNTVVKPFSADGSAACAV